MLIKDYQLLQEEAWPGVMEKLSHNAISSFLGGSSVLLILK